MDGALESLHASNTTSSRRTAPAISFFHGDRRSSLSTSILLSIYSGNNNAAVANACAKPESKLLQRKVCAPYTRCFISVKVVVQHALNITHMHECMPDVVVYSSRRDYLNYYIQLPCRTTDGDDTPRHLSLSLYYPVLHFTLAYPHTSS